MKMMWQLKTMSVFVLMTAFMIGIGYLIGWFFGYGIVGLTIMLFLSIGLSFYSYWFSKSNALRANKVRVITELDDPHFYGIVKRVAMRAGLPMPEVGISEYPMPNAFATGRDPQHAAVVATRGLLNLLTDEEIEAVIGHEMAHVKNRDILVMTVASTIVSVLTFAARVVFWSILFDDRRSLNAATLAIGVLCMIFVPIAAIIMQLAVSRNREYLADETGARITGKPLQLANALRRLDAGCAMPNNNYSDTAHADMWIANPIRRGAFKSLFSTHPSTDERIKRLEALSAEMGAGKIPAYAPEEDSSKSKLSFQ